MEPTLEQIILKLPEYFLPDQAMGVNITAHLILQNGTLDYWTLKIENLRCEVRHAKTENPKFELTASSSDLLNILSGNLDVPRAYMQGKISLRGNILQAMKLLEMFHIPDDILGKIRF